MEKVVVITGGSSGIGLNTARALALKGCRVYEISRREAGTDAAVHIRADVTDEAGIRLAIQQVVDKEKHIDVVINNAGFGISGATEYTDIGEAQRQFDVNFFGMARVNRVILPIMRRQGYGRIINISSVAAKIAIPFQAYYSASKAAMTAYSMALYSEVKPYGIEVCTIMAGDASTGFTDAREKNLDGNDEYDGRILRSVGVMEHDELTGITAGEAGEYVAGKALKKRVPVLCTLGGKYKLFVFLTRLLPTKIIVELVGKIYA
ncbi:MAG: SDR family NAD(P)-dependent oxidoreductase [Lachnospiraceae bacterium]|nr:SDR family NAD(P)-dependent oxidoreductase [Lachnospiraceae bacterium]